MYYVAYDVAVRALIQAAWALTHSIIFLTIANEAYLRTIELMYICKHALQIELSISDHILSDCSVRGRVKGVSVDSHRCV